MLISQKFQLGVSGYVSPECSWAPHLPEGPQSCLRSIAFYLASLFYDLPTSYFPTYCVVPHPSFLCFPALHLILHWSSEALTSLTEFTQLLIGPSWGKNSALLSPALLLLLTLSWSYFLDRVMLVDWGVVSNCLMCTCFCVYTSMSLGLIFSQFTLAQWY